MKNNLSPTGLSLSQAQSISNLCYQRALEIDGKLKGINNATKSFKHGGETHVVQVGKPMPKDVSDLVLEKAKLHAVQAFLMTNIKAKDVMLRELKTKMFTPSTEAPEKPKFEECDTIPQVTEDWGWDQLSPAEIAEFLEKEAYAAHIGSFIHKDSPLDRLRRDLDSIKTVEYVSLKDGERTPVTVVPHHTSEELLKCHEDLAGMHREYEQRVNYFKAKVKNLVTEENARIARENAVALAAVNKRNGEVRLQWVKDMEEYQDKMKVEIENFESARQAEISKVAAYRISVNPLFKDTVDMFLKNLKEEE